MSNPSIPDPDGLIAASRERFQRAQAAASSLSAFVDALLLHVNEVAHLIRDERADNGHIFRIGLSFLTDDDLVVPVPFRKQDGQLFIDQFHVMPLNRTTLGNLLESGVGDTIPDMEAHLHERGQSLSTQVALREGVRSNARFPWFSLDRKGFLYYSATVPRFFGEELMAFLGDLVPQVELQLRLFDSMRALGQVLRGQAGKPLLEKNPVGLDRLVRLLDVAENPDPARITVDSHPARPGQASLVNLWRRDEHRLFLLAMLMDDDRAEALNLLLLLRGLFMQQAARRINPSRILEEVELAFQRGKADGWIALQPENLSGLAIACIHLDQGYMDFIQIGRSQLRLGSSNQPLETTEGNLLVSQPRSARICSLGAGSSLLVEQPGLNGSAPAERLRLSLRNQG